MPTYPYFQLDVFTHTPFGGNQLAVFPDARGMSDQEMQTITREMNFSESTFVFPPQLPVTQRKVRIFTPAMEMPMAGHPTVGTAALLSYLNAIDVPDEGGASVLELNIGPVPVIFEAVEPDSLERRRTSPLRFVNKGGALRFVWMQHRPPEFGETRVDRAAAAAALGLAERDLRPDLPMQVVSTGVPFLFVPLVSLDAARRARSEREPLAGLFDQREPVNVALLTEETTDPAVRLHCRMFSPHVAGIAEDPATGSMAAPLAGYMDRYGLLPPDEQLRFVIEQGLEMERPSQIHVEIGRSAGEIVSLRIGGYSVLVGQGTLTW